MQIWNMKMKMGVIKVIYEAPQSHLWRRHDSLVSFMCGRPSLLWQASLPGAAVALQGRSKVTYRTAADAAALDIVRLVSASHRARRRLTHATPTIRTLRGHTTTRKHPSPTDDSLCANLIYTFNKNVWPLHYENPTLFAHSWSARSKISPNLC